MARIKLVYLGGNGFYWRIARVPELPHIIELRRAEGGEVARRGAAGEDLRRGRVRVRILAGSGSCFERSTEVAMRSRVKALVPLDGYDAPGAQGQQRARQSAGARAYLDNRGVFERARGARDARGEVEVEQKILPERFARR